MNLDAYSRVFAYDADDQEEAVALFVTCGPFEAR
jgi:hypothetical protein